MLSGEKHLEGLLSGAVARSGERNTSPPRAYLPETLAHIDRVTADGGTVPNPDFVDDFYRLALDLDVLDQLGVFIAPAAGVKVTSGAVEKLYDLSANEHDMTQSTSGSRPAYVASSQGGKPSMEFDDDDDYMPWTDEALGLLRDVDGVTSLEVFKHNTVSTANTNYYRVVFSTGTSSTAARMWTAANGTGGTLILGGRRLDSDGSVLISASGQQSTDWEVLANVISYANRTAHIYRGDTAIASSTTFQTSGRTSDTDSQQAAIGGRAEADRSMDGLISAVMVFPVALASDVRLALTNWLTQQFNV